MRGWMWMVTVCMAIASGCGEPKLAVVPAEGQLLVNGKPATGARVFFHPAVPLPNGLGAPIATVADDGSYRPTTLTASDGLPLGEYKVTVVWPKLTEDQGEIVEGPDQLRGRFSKVEYPAATVAIVEGENQIPLIDLKVQ